MYQIIVDKEPVKKELVFTGSFINEKNVEFPFNLFYNSDFFPTSKVYWNNEAPCKNEDLKKLENEILKYAEEQIENN